MRVAISGAHATGKSTLAADLAHQLPRHVVIDELYYALLAEGHDFLAEPTAADFEAMLERSMATLRDTPARDVIFDRCPVDYLAYMAACTPRHDDPLGDWVARTMSAVESIDLIVFVPVEQPDRVDVPVSEGRRLRHRVDGLLRDILIEDAWGLGARVLKVSGTPDDRVRQVLVHARELDL